MQYIRGYNFLNVSKFSLGSKEAILETTERIKGFSIYPDSGSLPKN